MSKVPVEVDFRDWDLILELLARYVPGRPILVFGSRVTGNFKPYSDLDLAVKGQERLTLGELADLTNAFSESDLPFKVDVVDWVAASDSFRAVIAASAVPLDQVIPVPHEPN